MKNNNYVKNYINEVVEICNKIDTSSIAHMIEILKETRSNGGRLFILGIGGSAGNASHAVNDFRKIAKLETYTPADNFSEFSARVNDEGWDTSYSEWLKVSKLSDKDCIMILSVGGGSETTSKNLVESMKLAKIVGSKILSIVSRDGGHAKTASDCCVLIPVVNEERITPHAEEWQGVVWHLVVNCLIE